MTRASTSRWVVVCVLAFCTQACAAAFVPSRSGSLEADLQAVADHYAKDGSRLGVGLLHRDPDGHVVAVSSGFADAARTVRLEPGYLYEIGSATKTFVATVVLQLVEEGALGLDDTLAMQGIDVRGADAITIRMLLGHTSGIPDYFDSPRLFATDDDYVRPHTDAELIAMAEVLPRTGSGWSYSNTNYVIAGIIVGSVTGHSIGHEIRARILEPLAMTRTFFRAEELIPVELSTSLAGSFNLVGEVYWDAWSGVHPTIYSSAGCMVSTLEDMAALLVALFDGRLLRPESLEAMEVFTPTANPFDYGLGLLRMKQPFRGFVGHGGTTVGSRGIALANPSRGAVVLYFSNLGNDDIDPLGRSIEAVISAYAPGRDESVR